MNLHFHILTRGLPTPPAEPGVLEVIGLVAVIIVSVCAIVFLVAAAIDWWERR